MDKDKEENAKQQIQAVIEFAMETLEAMTGFLQKRMEAEKAAGKSPSVVAGGEVLAITYLAKRLLEEAPPTMKLAMTLLQNVLTQVVEGNVAPGEDLKSHLDKGVSSGGKMLADAIKASSLVEEGESVKTITTGELPPAIEERLKIMWDVAKAGNTGKA